MRVVQSFNLQQARRGAPLDCPRHGLSPCSCQVIILLVYAPSRVPQTLMLSGSADRTRLSLDQSTEGISNADLSWLIWREILTFSILK
jgi:hypothetical protein